MKKYQYFLIMHLILSSSKHEPKEYTVKQVR